MEYYFLKPPFEIIEFEKMNKKQAQQYFDWYIGELPHQIEFLSEHIKIMKYKCVLDFSIESLKDLWFYFELDIKTISLNDKQIIEANKNLPEWLIEHELENQRWEFSKDCLIIGFAIAAYFSETFIKNTSEIYWGFLTKPKTLMSLNEPVLLGFKYKKDLNPRLVLQNCMSRSVEEKKPNRLFDLYHKWNNYI